MGLFDSVRSILGVSAESDATRAAVLRASPTTRWAIFRRVTTAAPAV
jgi:hypothetical protein